jgi:phytoene synthase
MSGQPARTGRRRARQILAAGSKSFALAVRLLPAHCRQDAAVVYAYCRRADDRVDLAAPGLAAVAVAALERELAGLYAGAPQDDPVLAAFQEVVGRRQIPRQAFDDLLAGFAMDARPGPMSIATWDELHRYCYRVAGTVGVMMCHVMGASDQARLRPAAALGMAMQLTNIARDVGEDWARGRIYLPRELLGTDLTPGPPMSEPARAALSAALPALLALARTLYQEADAGIDALPGRCAVAVRAARLIYSAIGDRLAAQAHDVTAPRAIVPAWRKLVLLLRALFSPRRPRSADRSPAGLRPIPAPVPGRGAG